MKHYLLAAAFLLTTAGANASQGEYDNPNMPTHFAGCTKDRVDYFSYAQDDLHAVELCRTKDGWMFTYGLVNGKSIEQFKILKMDMSVINDEDVHGLRFRHMAIYTESDGHTYFHSLPLFEPRGSWVFTWRLDETTPGYVNKLYKVRKTKG